MTKISKILLGLGLTLVVLLLVLLRPWTWTGSSKVPLAELKNLQELQTAFNQDKGKIRLILLLSPT